MSIGKLVHNIFFTEAENWFFARIPAQQVPEKEQYEMVNADEHYVQIDIKSLYITNSRKGISKFHGVVHSFIKVPHLDGENLEFNVVTTPAQLKNLDKEHIDRVIPVNIPILGQIPFRGGGIQMQMGLFSIKSSDLIAPMIDLFSEMSETAGVSFINTALPYAKFLNRGISILAGSEKDTSLEIGISTTMLQIKTGYYVMMRAPKDEVDIKNLHIADDDFKIVGDNGKTFNDFPYIVYKISATSYRSDWFLIPEIKSAYQKLKVNIKNLQLKEAEVSLVAFESILFASSDLLFHDAEKIFDKVKAMADRILSVYKNKGESSAGVRTAGANKQSGQNIETSLQLPELKDLNPF